MTGYMPRAPEVERNRERETCQGRLGEGKEAQPKRVEQGPWALAAAQASDFLL